MAAEPKLETLTEEECLALLSTVTIGPVGVTIDALPGVLPLEYVFDKGVVVFRTAPGTKLHRATANAVVAFEADDHSSAHHRFGWSVLVRGVAQPITDPLLLTGALALRSKAHDWDRDAYSRLEPAIVSRRRVVP